MVLRAAQFAAGEFKQLPRDRGIADGTGGQRRSW